MHLLAFCALALLLPSTEAFFQNMGKPGAGASVKSKPSADALANSIAQISRGKDNGIRVTPSDRAKVLEYVASLEAQNPSRVISR